MYGFDVLVFEGLHGDVEVDCPGAVDYGCEFGAKLGDVRFAEAEVRTAEIAGESEDFASLLFVEG